MINKSFSDGENNNQLVSISKAADFLEVHVGTATLFGEKEKALESKITEHRKTEVFLLETLAKLRESEQLNSRIVENSADSIKVLDLEGNLLSINNSGLKLMEIDGFENVNGRNYRDFWNGEYLVLASNAIEEAKTGKVKRFTGNRLTLKGKAKWWDVCVSPILDNNGKPEKLLVISRDITYLKELDQRKEDFLNATSHELKTPLTSQQAFIQLLKRELTTGKKGSELKLAGKIEAQSKKLYRIISDLLDVSKIQNGKLLLNKKAFSLDNLIDNSIKEVNATYSHHTFAYQNKVKQKVHADKDKISQVMLNLLTNAVKFSPNGTEVAVNILKSDGVAVVSVKDRGIGIDKKYHHKIFERFFQMDGDDPKSYPGLGMGLFISSEIVKLHGGNIWVDSEKGRGSTFSFTIPLML